MTYLCYYDYMSTYESILHQWLSAAFTSELHGGNGVSGEGKFGECISVNLAYSILNLINGI